MSDTVDIHNLVIQAQNGNVEAFEELVKIYDKRVLSLAIQLVGNTEDAEDIYQDVFMKVYAKLDQFRQESHFYTWLYRIVVNCAISYRKKRNRQVHQSIDEMVDRKGDWQYHFPQTGQSPERHTINNEILEQVQSTMDKLSLMERVVFILRFFEDFKIKDISEITGCAEGTVKNFLFRSTRKMRKDLLVYIET